MSDYFCSRNHSSSMYCVISNSDRAVLRCQEVPLFKCQPKFMFSLITFCEFYIRSRDNATFEICKVDRFVDSPPIDESCCVADICHLLCIMYVWLVMTVVGYLLWSWNGITIKIIMVETDLIHRITDLICWM